MTSDECTLIFSLIFSILLILVGALRYSKKNNTTLKDTLIMIWRECFVDGFKELRKNFIPVTKTILGKIWEYAKKKAPKTIEKIVKFFHLDPEPVKHTFTDELYCALQTIANNYTYKYLVPVIRFFYIPIPSYIWVSLYYNKGTITDDVIAEIVWAMRGAFQSYMDAYGLNFQFQAFPYVERNRIVIRLYYCEFDSEYPAYQSTCDKIMRARSTTRPLNEADTYDRDF